MVDTIFSESPTEQSIAKTTIVTKYFPIWANIILRTGSKSGRGSGRIAYMDLFAGPGRYADGTESTPLHILKMAIDTADLREHLVTVFNDKDPKCVESLNAWIKGLEGIGSLRYQPQVLNAEVGDDFAAMFERMRLVPTLCFIDPYGYKGLTLRLVGSVLRDWGCDCIFFFNYNRVRPGLENSKVREHMDALFGVERAEALDERLSLVSPTEAELIVVEELTKALQEIGGQYVLPFRFRDDGGHRTSHYLFFVNKHVLGYEKMKEVMYACSSERNQGVATFQYCPADRTHPRLFEYARPLDDLGGMLLERFAGQAVTMQRVYKLHNVGTPYVRPNYKQALSRLEEAGVVEVLAPTGKTRRKGTFADDLVIRFPPRV